MTSTMWDTIFNDPLWINGFDLGPNGVFGLARFDTDLLDGWYSTQNLDTSQSGILNPKTNSVSWQNFAGTGKALTLSGTIRAVTRYDFDTAYSALVLACPENQVVQLRRITPLADQTMNVRIAGQIQLTEYMGDAGRFTIPLVADDILKYSTDDLSDVITSLPPGLYARTYPRVYPLQYGVSTPTQLTRTLTNYCWNPIPNLSTNFWANADTSGSGWNVGTTVATTSVTDGIIPTGSLAFRSVVATGKSNIDGGSFFQLAPGTDASGLPGTQSCDVDFWTSGRVYTVSCYVRASTNISGQLYRLSMVAFPVNGGVQTNIGWQDVTVTTSFQRVSFTCTVPDGFTIGDITFYCQQSPTNTAGDSIDMLGLMIEQGTNVDTYFDGSATFGGFWSGAAYGSDSYLLSQVAITPGQYKWVTNLHNNGNADMFPISTITGPLPAGWSIQNMSTGKVMTVNFTLPNASSIVIINHNEETAIATATGQTAGLPIEYLCNGDFWALEPGDNTLRLASTQYNPVANWAIDGKSAWR